MKTIFAQYAMQMVWALGILVLFGVLLEVATARFLKNTGRGGRVFFVVTGALGTPVHELSHAVMCLLFRHRIRKICLFAPNSETGTLGYVEHVYQKNNLYHRVGNFFIGIAPMLGGSLLMIVLVRFLLPETYSEMQASFPTLGDGAFSPFELSTYPVLFSAMGGVLAALFAPANFARPVFWVFFLLAVMIAMHLDISPADLATAKVGFGFFAAMLFAFDASLYVVSPQTLESFTGAVLYGTSVVLVLLLPAAVILLAALLVSVLIRIFTKESST